MSLTPNFGMNIPDASDIVNLLTQCYPNFTLLDTALQTIKETGVSTATESKVGTVHNIVRTVSDCAVFWFTATSNFTAGDTFTVDGVSVSAVKVSGAGLETGDFVINSNVPCIVKGGILTVLAGGGLSNVTAQDVTYDNTVSGLTATDVQDAIDEVVADIPTGFSASAITYDNTGSGLTATNTQDAIDELASNLGSFVKVTAVGTETNRQIMQSLFALINESKITKNAKLVVPLPDNDNKFYAPVVRRSSGVSIIASGTYIFETAMTSFGFSLRSDTRAGIFSASGTTITDISTSTAYAGDYYFYY